MTVWERIDIADKALMDGDLLGAERIYKEILDIDPDNPDVLYKMGLIELHKNNPDSAIEYYLKLIGIEPAIAEYHYELGQIYQNNEDINNAHKAYLNAVRVNPLFEEGHIALGNIYSLISNYDQAIGCLFTALNINPDNPVTNNLLGSIYKGKNDIEKSKFYYEKALNAYPDSPEIKYNLAGVYLLIGNFDKGWDFFESRIECLKEHKLKFPVNIKPKWDGKDNISGKTVYIYNATAYYAYGDSIMFARYMPVIASMGAKVICKPQPCLYELFKNNFLNVEIIDEGKADDSIDFDYQLPIMSLAHPFKSNESTIPFKDRYIRADKSKVEYYRKKFFDNDKFKLGIVWNCHSPMDKRSMPLEIFDVLSDFDINIYSLQKDEDISGSKLNLINIAETFNDFSDTAAAIENLDLVITVDTATTHLVGAMGKATWVLLDYTANWKWFFNSDKSSWYNSAKLFRQDQPGNWRGVLDKVSSSLADLLKYSAQNR